MSRRGFARIDACVMVDGAHRAEGRAHGVRHRATRDVGRSPKVGRRRTRHQHLLSHSPPRRRSVRPQFTPPNQRSRPHGCLACLSYLSADRRVSLRCVRRNRLTTVPRRVVRVDASVRRRRFARVRSSCERARCTAFHTAAHTRGTLAAAAAAAASGCGDPVAATRAWHLRRPHVTGVLHPSRSPGPLPTSVDWMADPSAGVQAHQAWLSRPSS